MTTKTKRSTKPLHSSKDQIEDIERSMRGSNKPRPRKPPADGLQIEHIPPGDLAPDERNARTHPPEQIGQIIAAVNEWGWTNPILIDERNGIIAGHARRDAGLQMGRPTVPCIRIVGLSAARRRALMLADNQIALNAGWDEKLLAEELVAIGDLAALVGFNDEELQRLMMGPGGGAGTPPMDLEVAKQTLAQRFGVPPFTVLNAREGWWQERKAAWLALGIRSEIGRGENLLQFSDTINEPDPKKRAAKKKSKEAVHAAQA